MLTVTLIILNFLLAIAFSIIVLSRRKAVPAITLAWLLTFFLLPYIGVFVYLLVGYRHVTRRKRLKQTSLEQAISTLEKNKTHPELDKKTFLLSQLAQNLTHFPVTTKNLITLLQDPFSANQALAQAILDAKHHIYMEYYIFRDDETGLYFRDLLIQRAKEGIECKLLFDNIGSFGLSREFLSPLQKAGVDFAFFAPVKISRPWGLHLRNHRKLTIVDGHTGFIGSQNIGKYFFKLRRRLIPWRDSDLKITGPAVAQLQTIFIEDWRFTTGEKIAGAFYFHEIKYFGESIIQTLPTGPDEHENSLEIILSQMIYSAEKQITITTPYFIPTQSIILALTSAAKRGVSLQLLVPTRSDNFIVDWAARSWYLDLLLSGAEIYEFAKTFVHAKIVTIDDKISLVGSANMDERSFRLNFECSVLLYDNKITTELKETFNSIKKQSKKITLQSIENQPFIQSLRDGIFKVLSPIL